jgi:hypothetical protein
MMIVWWMILKTQKSCIKMDKYDEKSKFLWFNVKQIIFEGNEYILFL